MVEIKMKKSSKDTSSGNSNASSSINRVQTKALSKMPAESSKSSPLKTQKLKKTNGTPQKEGENYFDKHRGEIDGNSGRTKRLQEKLTKTLSKALKSKVIDLSNSTHETLEETMTFNQVPQELIAFIEDRNKAPTEGETNSAVETLIKQVWLSNHRISLLTSEIGCFQGIQTLSLSNNLLTTLPKEIATLTSLHRLFLDRNDLRALPDTMGGLFNLRELQLDRNNFEHFPIQIVSLINLTRLGLSGNKIIHVPSDIRKLRHLVELDLDNNLIGPELPVEMGSLRCLRFLGLENNCIAQEPSFLRGMNLIQIRLSGNRSSEYTKVASKDTPEDEQEVIDNIPIRHDGYLKLQSAHAVINEDNSISKQVVPLQGYLDASRLYNMRNGNYSRDSESLGRKILHARSLKKRWKSHNRLISTQ